jgi:2,4-dienoyl-CoA reductase-like NADH-dependent reductase (Old Yellow Enzyme family)
MDPDVIFRPLDFPYLKVKNRLFRSNITGRFDNYDGTGTQARINWEVKFAQGGVGAILSSFVPVHVRGRVQPNYAFIDNDDKIPFWRQVGQAVHQHDCKYILQLSHSGRQRDLPGAENFMQPGLSSTNKADYFHGLLSQAMTRQEIAEVVEMFAQGARRAREAGLDGVELHASHGYLFTQFLSSGINDREDQYGGPLENRARFLLEVIAAIRKTVGRDYHVGVKVNAIDFNNALYPFEKPGNTLEESKKVCKWIEEAGADHLHISIGSIFPHPLLPSGGFPPDELNWWYGIMGSSGVSSYRNYAFFHFKMLRPLFLWAWNRTKKDHPIEGIVAPYARAIKQAVGIPVICTGGFQDAGLIRKVLSDGTCDAVSIGRPLVANNDLPLLIKEKKEIAQPCTFCNRCLVNAVYNPLGCYDVTRFDYDQRAMIDEAMRVFDPSRKPYVYKSGPRVLRGKTYSIKAMGVTFIDLVRNSPVDCYQLRFRRRLLVVASVALLVVLALGFPSFWR